jgi:hypothetical protein
MEKFVLLRDDQELIHQYLSLSGLDEFHNHYYLSLAQLLILHLLEWYLKLNRAIYLYGFYMKYSIE